MTLMGIEIGGSKLQAVLGDHNGRITERRSAAVDRVAGARGIQDQLRGMMDELRALDRPEAVGVGFGGPYDRERGVVAKSFHIEGWDDFPLTDWMRRETGLPVHIDNDTNTGALAEARRGAGRNFRRVFYTNMGSGQGGGMVIDGRIYHGAPPGESELGLVPWDRTTGATLQSRCSGWALNKRARSCAESEPGNPLARMIHEDPGAEARHLWKAAEAGDPGAAAILDEFYTDLAWGLSVAVLLFHPDAVVLGGGLAQAGEALRAGAAERFPRYLTEAYAPGPEIRLSALGQDVVTTGALLLAAEAVRP